LGFQGIPEISTLLLFIEYEHQWERRSLCVVMNNSRWNDCWQRSRFTLPGKS